MVVRIIHYIFSYPNNLNHITIDHLVPPMLKFWDLTWVAQVFEISESVTCVKRPLSVAVFAMGVVHLIVIHHDDEDEDGVDHADDAHRGELDSLDSLQVEPGENQVELFIVKDCDAPSIQVLVVGGRPEKHPDNTEYVAEPPAFLY